jgi:hypothetical protein
LLSGTLNAVNTLAGVAVLGDAVSVLPAPPVAASPAATAPITMVLTVITVCGS